MEGNMDYRSLEVHGMDPNRPNDIVYEDAATMDDGKVTMLTIEPSNDGNGYDVSVHPVTADGTTQYDVNIVSDHEDSYDEAKEVFDALQEDWNTGTDNVDEYEKTMEDAGFSKDDIFVNDTFDPMSRYDVDNEEDSVDKDEDDSDTGMSMDEDDLEGIFSSIDEEIDDYSDQDNQDEPKDVEQNTDDGIDIEKEGDIDNEDRNDNADGNASNEDQPNDIDDEKPDDADSDDDDDWGNDWGDSVD